MPPQGLQDTDAARDDAHATGSAFTIVPSTEPVALMGLPASAWPLIVDSGLADPRKGASVMATPGELTLIVPWGSAPVARGLFPGIRVDGPFRVLTLDAWREAEWLTRVLKALTDAGVPARATTSVERDHVIVLEEDADRAVEVLRELAIARA